MSLKCCIPSVQGLIKFFCGLRLQGFYLKFQNFNKQYADPPWDENISKSFTSVELYNYK